MCVHDKINQLPTHTHTHTIQPYPEAREGEIKKIKVGEKERPAVFLLRTG